MRAIKNTERFSIELINKKYYEFIIFEDVDFTEEDLKITVQFQKEIDPGKYPVLILPHPTAIAQAEFLKHLSNDDNAPFNKADAFVLSSIAQRILASLYKRFIGKSRPTEFFKNKEEALNWLKQYF
ncbi:MAG: hypothetical protein IPM51_11110 [Sphingobacteriaceae bacterium]|nr:hypothetical protein [Sphingobacteriaceae bacterium]